MTVDPRLAAAVLTIDLAAVAANYRLLAARVAPAECAAVVKADAYGLGVARVAPALAAAGARRFFVAHLSEAITLRAVLPDAAIGVLNGVLPGCEADFVAHRLAPVLNHLGEIARWAGQARQHGAPLPAFIHLDTGMRRLGLPPAEIATLAAEPQRLDGIALHGWLSHLACADEAGHPMSAAQRTTFGATLARLPPAPATLANSSGVFLGPDYHFDLARPGAALYGVNPTPWTDNPMAGTVRLEAPVLQVRDIDTGDTVGYGATHTTRHSARIATLPIGYADGYLRSLSGRGHVRIAGREAPVVGRVSMDLITVDVTSLPQDAVHPGTPVELIGPGQPVDAVARDAGTIGYEILTALGRRYARHYLDPAP